MGHPYQFLLPLLSLFWVRVDLTDLYPLAIKVHVVNIHDGDTITVRSRNLTMKVRLAKIDAPEMRQPFHLTKIDAGKFSRDCLRKLTPAVGKLTVYGFDMYHRTLGDFENINYRSIEEGCSGLYPHAGFSSVHEKMEYLKAMLQAKKERRGVWAHGGYVLPKKWRKLSKRNGHRPWHR